MSVIPTLTRFGGETFLLHAHEDEQMYTHIQRNIVRIKTWGFTAHAS